MAEAAGNRSAVITGGTRGIGLAVARRLAEDGFDLLRPDRGDDEGARAAQAELAATGVRVEVLQADVATADGAGATIET
ncbi:MAG: SDR family NAD(P)-dependent oxidoreductase, partial [Chloroflexota bacterium]